MRNNHGFSLVELSIVLVILGLLTGGILTGQSLINAAELRSITTEYANFQTALHTFRGKYFALPGDMDNAESFWNSFASCGGGGLTDINPTTCNGDGDNFITDADNAEEVGESVTFWQHMALANMIEGSYIGVAGAGDEDEMIPGVNTPASGFSGGGWSVDQYVNMSGNSHILDNNAGQVLLFGATTPANETENGVMLPEDAWNIDKKLDDGQPARGGIFANQWDDCTNAANSADSDADYALNETQPFCALVFNHFF